MELIMSNPKRITKKTRLLPARPKTGSAARAQVIDQAVVADDFLKEATHRLRLAEIAASEVFVARVSKASDRADQAERLAEFYREIGEVRRFLRVAGGSLELIRKGAANA